MTINLSPDNLIYPYFVAEGVEKREFIKSFPGQFRFSIDWLLKDIGESKRLGLNKILLFGIPVKKDPAGSEAYKTDGIIPLAIKAVKSRYPHMTVMTDVCLCAYTSHGHCRIIKRSQVTSHKSQDKITKKQGVYIDNDETLKILAKIALAHARAGADWVAPSAMAKGQVSAIRKALDGAGYSGTKILAYSAKFFSNFYGPFRNAADSAPKFGDRSAYQLDYGNRDPALTAIKKDIEDGADMVMVKPALSYLDVVREAKNSFSHPLAAYNVSGEYAFLKYGADLGLWDEKKMVMEIITSIRRAGADYVITYHAKDIAKWILKEEL